MRFFTCKLLVITGLLLAFSHHLMAQSSLSGRVSSEGNVPIRAALVKLEESGQESRTNSDGYYQFNGIRPGEYTVLAGASGYATKSLTIKIEGSTELNLNLVKSTIAEDVLITSLRASEKTATTYSSLDKEAIEAQNFGQDFPMLLDQLPSTVVTSDAGAGVGYTGIRIRGSDPTRVNVTINGIPLNDAESHGVFWVNMPDFASSVNSVQVQRGVGTSTNGAGAFGASLNLQTNSYEVEPYARISNSGGSFNTLRNNISLGTGLLGSGFSFDARLSSIQSDGWVDRASSNLKSWFVSGGYYGAQSYIKANVFSGHEITYQSWYGVPEALIDGDEEALIAHYNRNIGGIYQTRADSVNLFSSDRRYNYYLYDNQVDDYQQTHYQLLFGHDFAGDLNLSGGLHYTRGQGFFEEFREEDAFASYPVFGVNQLAVGGDTLTTTDLIRRRWLDNHFYGGVFSLTYKPNTVLGLSLGGGLNQYDGDHFGELIWARHAANSSIRDRFYSSRSLKTDGNVYLKANIDLIEKLSAYVDLQVRTVDYQLGDSTLSSAGTDNDQQPIQGQYNWLFFNPKVGISFNATDISQFYASFAIGNREPVRSDIIDNPVNAQPSPETLYNVEAGYRLRAEKVRASANLYYMYYQNQLVITGALNDVGANIRQNVPESYRAGVELTADWKPEDWVQLSANLTLSQNKIANFTEYIYDYGTFPATVEQIDYQQSDIAFSPSIIAGGRLSFFPIKNMEISWVSKYVGKQFLDNTSNEARVLDAFFVNDIRFNYTLRPSFTKAIRIGLLVNNVLDEAYEANGYTYSYRYGELITENYYYAQAGRNFLISLDLDL
jgi:iron complex outermembrane receptor protein